MHPVNLRPAIRLTAVTHLEFLAAYSCLRLRRCDVLELPHGPAEDPVGSLSGSLSVAEDMTSIFGRARLGKGRMGRARSVIWEIKSCVPSSLSLS